MTQSAPIRYALGGDHAGFLLKNEVFQLLQSQSVSVIDCGTHSAESCDFPDFSEMVARMILSKQVERGI
jgi:ribose 5-phosphate isomerase B